MITSFRYAVFAAMCAMFACAASWAQDTYPDKAIRLVVPFPAGGGADILARSVTPKMAQALGQAIVVENRPGAGGNLGTEFVAKSAPNGYTLVFGHNGTFGINHGLYARTGFDPIKDFAGRTPGASSGASATACGRCTRSSTGTRSGSTPTSTSTRSRTTRSTTPAIRRSAASPAPGP